jgi:GT2 family glycosyltransferase
MQRASLIVLNFNGLDVLDACLASLARDLHCDDEIIVVDNNSTDGSAEMVKRRYPTVSLVRLPENRFIFGLNDGLLAARGEYVAFLNNDIVAEPGFIDALVRGFDSESVFAVCARILDPAGKEQGSRTAGYWANGLLHYQSLPHSDVATDCFFAVGGQSLFRRSYLEQMGSIDELLWPMYHEDIELSYRAWKHGWTIRYAPDAVVHHLGGHTSRRVFRASDLRTFVRQNEFLTVWKDVTDRRLLARHLFLIPPRVLKAVAVGDLPTLRGLGRAIRRLPQVPAARRSAKRHFERTDREVLDLVAEHRIELEASERQAAR